MGEEVVAKYGRHLSEKVLRLFEETSSQEKFCSLREEWEMSEVEPGDIVHITGMDICICNLKFFNSFSFQSTKKISFPVCASGKLQLGSVLA